MISDLRRPSRLGAGQPFTACAALIALAVVSACQKTPGGQVVAVVDGHEITQQDVRAQAQADNVASKAAFEAAKPAIVQRLVDRTILAQYARKNKLDRGVEYVARRRQMEETLLAYVALRKLVGNVESPSTAEAQAFIAANPTIFAQRQRLTLDQLRFPTPSDPNETKRLTQLNSLDAISAQLKVRGIKFTRGTAYLDSGSLDPFMGKQIVGLGNGQIFDISMNGQSYVSEIKSRAPVWQDPSTWPAQALNAVHNQRLRKVVAGKLASLKKSAKVQYDPAYEPKRK